VQLILKRHGSGGINTNEITIVTGGIGSGRSGRRAHTGRCGALKPTTRTKRLRHVNAGNELVVS
jgi:hypothetical protein